MIIIKSNEYRFSLWRCWDVNLPRITWIMLNPSIVDDDPTTKRVIEFSKDWGYGSLYIVNLYAVKSTNQYAIFTFNDPIGPSNDHYILEAVSKSSTIVAAWGNLAQHERVNEIIEKIEKPIYCLGTTKTGSPLHPLRVSKYKKLEEFYDRSSNSEGPS